METAQDLPLVFADSPSHKLQCALCNKVFTDPVLAAGCGHSFCKGCTTGYEKCPLDQKDFQILVPNINLLEQVSDLGVHCMYGCRLNNAKTGYEHDPDGCPEVLKYGHRREHEEDCCYKMVSCPQNSSCPPLRKRDLEEHLAVCQKVLCTYEKYGCSFYGFEQELEAHLAQCPYEALKEYIARTDEQHKRLQVTLERTTGELEFVKSVLGSLSSRMDAVDIVESSQEKLMVELIEVKRENVALSEHLEQLTDVVNALSSQYQALTLQQSFRCMGTFVGHQGPVWCLDIQADYLFTGSGDKSIKVWHTGSSYTCIRTLTGHNDTVLCLTVAGRSLFSGGKDNVICEWDSETFEQKKTIKAAHENFYVCSLASNKKYLFSGSNYAAKIWDLANLHVVHECTGFQTWVRCLACREGVLYAGADVIKVISLDGFQELRTVEFSDANVHAYSLILVDNFLICGTGVGSLCVWHIETYLPVTILSGHSERVNCLAALQTPNGGVWKVFSASNDRSVRVWRLDYNICAQSLVRHQGGVLALAVSKGRLFSGSVDTTIKVWVPGP